VPLEGDHQVCGYDERMFSFVLSVLALTVVVGIFLSIFIGGAVYVARTRRNGTEAMLAGARRFRELR
jgi:hypothetical protein